MNLRILGAAALTFALAGSAFAADLPSRKAPAYLPPPPPPPLWTGFYAGLNAGYTFGGDSSFLVQTIPGAVFPAFLGNPAIAVYQATAAASASGALSPRADGFIGGGQVGYNYQFNNSFVVGIEADIQGSGARGSATGVNATPLALQPQFGVATTISVTKNLDYLGTVRGRIGYLFTPTLLAYATGGLAYGGVNSSVSTNSGTYPTPIIVPGSFPGSIANFSDTRVGWTVGGGLEWLFAPNWSVKAEYLYYDLGAYTFAAGGQNLVAFAGAPINVFSNSTYGFARFDGHIVRAGVNYHFNWGAPAPVVAKY
jgi:outer membrane immunogenic protein